MKEALTRDDIPDLTKKLIASAVSGKDGLQYKEYNGSLRNAPLSLYCI